MNERLQKNELIKNINFHIQSEDNQDRIVYSSVINLKEQPIYQEVILINNLAKDIEQKINKLNSEQRVLHRIDGYFYQPFDKNVYANHFAHNNSGGGHYKSVIMNYRNEETKKVFSEAANLYHFKLILIYYMI